MGSNQLVDLAIKLRDPIDAFLRQGSTERVTFANAIDGLMRLARLRQGFVMPDDRQTATNAAQKPVARRPAVRPPAPGAKT
jgi:hypothetical protein